MRVNCHFFTREEIELDIEPSEVDSEARCLSLLAFIKGIAERVGKDVIMTPENMQETVLLRYRAGEGRFEHTIRRIQLRPNRLIPADRGLRKRGPRPLNSKR